uniref:Uncharacterized protein n=1 Tax=Knipowitschia caucasica TaxID=637954 RepID=A0AAV2K6N6_KNICA
MRRTDPKAEMKSNPTDLYKIKSPEDSRRKTLAPHANRSVRTHVEQPERTGAKRLAERKRHITAPGKSRARLIQGPINSSRQEGDLWAPLASSLASPEINAAANNSGCRVD